MRSFYGVAVASLALITAAPVLAADYRDLRPAYPTSWENGEDNQLRFETGVRYWYSIGQHKLNVEGFSQTLDTKTHSGEAFVRIDDTGTSTYLEATAGYGFAHEGTSSTNGGAPIALPAARLGYVGADFGWLPYGNSSGGLGAVVGYQYTNDSPDTGRASFTVAKSANDIAWSPNTGIWSVGRDSKINDFNIHEAKIGLAGRADMGSFDLTGEATVTPYAWVQGTYGAVGTDTVTNGLQTIMAGSEVSINGNAYGAGGKLLVGFHPTENLTLRVGGRVSYLQGSYDATYDRVTINHPVLKPLVPDATAPGGFRPADPPYSAPSLSRQTRIISNNPFSLFRYGALVELTGRF